MQTTGKLVLASAVSAAAIISHGFSFFSMAVCLYAAGTALLRGPRAVTLLAVTLGGFSLLSFGSGPGPALLTAGAVLAVAFSASTISRLLFCLSAAAVLFYGTIEGMIPIAAALFLASPLSRERWRSLMLAGGLMATLLISGLPSNEEHRIFVSEEVLIDNGLIWPGPVELNLSMPQIVLYAPGMDIAEMTLHVSAGGVRDHDPLGYAASGDSTFPVYPGENILLIEEPEFPVSIRISRPWKPFNHPVIHFDYGEASL